MVLLYYNISIFMNSEDQFIPFPQRNEINWTLELEGKSKEFQHIVHICNQRYANQTPLEPKSSIKNKISNKPNHFDISDIPGTKSRKIIPEQINKPNFTLITKDIPFCTSISKYFKTKRVVSPLNPHYKLPTSVLNKPPTPPPLIHHNILNNSDIPGTKAKATYTRSKITDPNDSRDIPLSYAGSLKEMSKRTSLSNNLKTRDITHEEVDTLISTRVVNPIDPEYIISSVLGTHKIRPISKNKPKQLIPKKEKQLLPHYN